MKKLDLIKIIQEEIQQLNGFVVNIEEETLKNEYYRRVLYTSDNLQLVVMSLNVNENIGMEIHKDVDQFIRIEKGIGKVIINNNTTLIQDGTSIIIPKEHYHDIVNTGNEPLKLYTLYSPPNHVDGTIHKTKQDAIEDEG